MIIFLILFNNFQNSEVVKFASSVIKSFIAKMFDIFGKRPAFGGQRRRSPCPEAESMPKTDCLKFVRN